MNEIQYIGEHAGLSVAGKLLIVFAFTASLLSAIAYLFATFKTTERSWIKIARASYGVHAVSVFSIFGLLYYLIYNHYFEFYYAWYHSSKTLPMRYIFSCFWEGQEGSFLLWTFWHVVLSIFIIKKGGEWESPVMAVIMLVQVFLTSMVLGIYIGDLHIGSNPFILLRLHPEMQQMPFVQMGNYLEHIQDGRGLNPLLQNYWMVIHPPTLFLGFASTVVPFAFAIAGLIRGKTTEWIRPAMPYTIFGVMILGTGILMGAAWAYEALSFGGFWAWDPVENSSLVPWLIFVSALHVMLIATKTGRAVLTSLVLIILTFVLILYSTFLTRSGILGDSSVHAFTDLGMQGQLVVYMAFFTILAIVLLLVNRKKIPTTKDEESLKSREFWMFIGSLVLVISAIQIIATTSIPVFNKMWGLKLAPPADLIGHYNKWQVPIAAIICLLFGVGQYLKYKDTDVKYFYRKIGVALLLSLVISILYQWYIQLPRWEHVLLLFSALFACIANLNYFAMILKGKINHSGASIAHAGIALILIGALVSNARKTIISQNHLAISLGKDLPDNENIMLRQGDTLQMGNYFVTYKGSQKDGINIRYEIEYYKLNHESGRLDKQFSLKPFIQLNDRMGNAAEPDTRHFFDRDIYTHITYAEIDKEMDNSNKDEYDAPKVKKLGKGDTISTSNSLLVFEKMEAKIDSLSPKKQIVVTAYLKAIDVNKKEYATSIEYMIENNKAYSTDGIIEPLGLKVSFEKILTQEDKIEIQIREKKSNRKDFVIMKAIIFPHINILWIGCLLMILGSLTALRKRLSDNKRLEQNSNA